jgi:hypothetical protein
VMINFQNHKIEEKKRDWALNGDMFVKLV